MTSIRRPSLVVSILAGTAAVVASFAIGGFTQRFVVAPVGSLVTNATPGAVLTVAIERLGSLAQVLAFGFALAVTIGLFAAVVRVALALDTRTRVPNTGVLFAFAGTWLAAVLLTGKTWDALGVAVAAATVVFLARVRWNVGRDQSVSADRRSVLKAAGVLAGVAGVSYFQGREITGVTEGPLSEILDEEAQETADERLAEGRARGFDVPDLDGIVSESFYEVDINSVNPNPTASRWSLSVTGAVDQELTFSYEDLLEMRHVHEFHTLRCVGESLNGYKMDTALWTGVPVGPILEQAGVQSGCECVMLRAADRYYEEFPIEALEPGLLAFGMNGQILPRGHGYPVRALVPGHWGEINVKWLTEIEVLDRETDGYWEKRGWHGTGPVNTVAKLHAVNHREESIELGGHAYAGTRGIERVEVSIDGGESWTDAELTDPLPDPDTWHQWRHVFEPSRDEHEVVVRAVDGTGELQPQEFQRPFPSGPTVWVSQTVTRQG